ncbi:hypothetical protein [Treponema sp.]|uniref:hypothetical protein n=1 Tax=Treponema sp. TaxID=166 RepID=UPI0025E1009F|nr:hypothetical protein [Treponema sp.]MBR4321557.1 hypothetical protein [Treponema sp.]
MAKKSNLPLYLIGMVLVVIGCFLPLTASKFFGGGTSAFNAITDGSGDLKIGSILALGGAIAGIVFCFVTLRAKLPVKLISLIVSIAGGIYVLLNYLNLAPWAKGIVKFAHKAAGTGIGIGLIVIVIGWLIALCGWLKTRD